jgi:hypothetical protein
MLVIGRSLIPHLTLLLSTFLNQQVIAEHLADDLFGLGFGFLLELAHGWPPGRRTASGTNVSSNKRHKPLSNSAACISSPLLRQVPHNVTILSQTAIGPDFKSGYVDALPVSNADVGATTAKIMELTQKPKGQLIGRVMTERCPMAQRRQPIAAP